MSEFFRPYEGDRPYLFVSYSHRDSAAVLDTINILNDHDYRLWYDEGIPAGSDWPRNIELHMNGCGMVLCFLSKNAMASPNCFSEIKTAAQLRKPILLLRLDDAAPNEAWSAILQDAVDVPSADTARERAGNIEACPALTDDYLGSEAERTAEERREGRRSAWTVGVVLAGVLFAAALAGLYGLATGRLTRYFVEEPPPSPTPAPTATPSPTPEPAVDMSRYGGLFDSYIEFPDAQQEKAVRTALDFPEGDVPREELLNVTELYFVGGMTPKELSGVSFREDGVCTVNGAPVIEGQVTDLSLIAAMPYLETLALICQPAEDVSGLVGLTLLRELSLAGGAVSELSGLSELPSLETLHLEHSAARDLTPLADLPGLATVTVSADMLPLTLDDNARYDVVLVK